MYQSRMVPLLRQGDLDGALLAALERRARRVTTDRAGRLQVLRVANALFGFGGVLLAVLLVVYFAWHWLATAATPCTSTARRSTWPGRPRI